MKKKHFYFFSDSSFFCFFCDTQNKSDKKLIWKNFLKMEKIRQRIKSLGEIEAGWDDGEGKEMNKVSGQCALFVLEAMHEICPFENPRCIDLSHDGHITVEWSQRAFLTFLSFPFVEVDVLSSRSKSTSDIPSLHFSLYNPPQITEAARQIRLLVPKVVVFADLVADLFHYGHMNFLRQARELGDELIVGLMSDEQAENYKRKPILSLRERALSVRECRSVTKVIEGSPMPVTREFLQEHHIQIVVHGDDFSSEQMDTWYSVPRELGMMRLIHYTEGISTTELLRRITSRLPSENFCPPPSKMECRDSLSQG